jgi:CHAT domain-containing protein
VISRATAIISKHLSVSLAQRSEAGDAERRMYRGLFTNYIAIGDGAAGGDSKRRAAMALETFRVAQLAQASSAGRAVAGMAARFAASTNALAQVIRERQDLAERWQKLDADIVRASSLPPAERKPAEEAALRTALDETGGRLDDLDKRIAAEFPDFAELSNPQPVLAEAAQKLLGYDEALLVYLTTNKEILLWVVRRGAIAFYRLPINAEALTHAVTVLRHALDPALNPDVGPFPSTDAYELYRKMLAPATSQLSGIRHLLIVPDGALDSLPLSVLLTQKPEHPPEKPADYRPLAWLNRDYAITVLPSVSSLGALRQLQKHESGSAPFPRHR